MSWFRHAALIAVCLAALAPAARPAVAVELALVQPGDSSAPAMQIGAVTLPPQAQAVKDALDRAAGARSAADRVLLPELRVFYEKRRYAPVWIADGAASLQMSGLRRTMDAAARYGLDPAAYQTPDFALAYPDDSARRATADVAFSRAAARFVTHLASGRFRPTAISSIITLEPERPDLVDALTVLSSTAGVALAVSRYEPPQEDYRALKAKLAEMRAGEAEAPRIVIGDGRSLKPGMRDARTPLLRSRLDIKDAADADPDVYDDALAEAVKAFQSSAKLTADGIVGPRTLALLNGVSREADIAAILVNMERWRWMPRDLGAFHIFVNVPAFTVAVVRDGATVDEHRVVVGAPDHATPTFSNAMTHLVVNPYWNVPVSIVSREMLPDIQSDPSGYFARRGYQVLARAGGKMQVVDPDSVDWWMLNPRSIRIRQVPGDANALGRIKFMFPNQHSVYLHDTPSKALFKKDYRAYSHGCVRVDDPLGFADAILAVASPNWNSAKLEKLYGGPERRIDLQRPVPIHLGYFTLTVDPSGVIHRYEDIYGYDAKMQPLVAS